MMKTPTLVSLALLAALSSCGDTQELYTRAYARLYFDNFTHNDPTLATAMTAHAGAFVTITASANQFRFVSNQGLSSVANITAIDTQQGFVLGMNGALIVGYGASVDATFYAYDRECPNCFSPDALPRRSYPIAVSEFGIGTCARCHRQYDLNNGGLVSSGDAGKKLSRYYATTTGPYGMLSVQ